MVGCSVYNRFMYKTAGCSVAQRDQHCSYRMQHSSYRVQCNSYRVQRSSKGATQLIGCSVANIWCGVAQIGCSVAHIESSVTHRMQRSSKGCSVDQISGDVAYVRKVQRTHI